MPSRLMSFTNGEFTFDVIDDGPLDGTPVVLLHGFPQTGSEWNRVTPYLHERGYRTFAPTQRGYSAGAQPRGRLAYRMSALVGDVAQLISTIDLGPVHLVGHDWGSAVAWSTAGAHPDLVRSLTSVSAPHPMAFMRSLVSSDQALRAFYMGLFHIPWLPELVLTAGFRASAWARLRRPATSLSGMDDEQFERMQREIVDAGTLTYALNWYRAMLVTTPRAAFQKVSAPTTHVWSTRDGVLVRKGAELSSEYVTGPFRLEILDATHWIPEERPAELAAIIAAQPISW
jgi:pimeloyl-ACP methyl ester carboxylesterase